MKPEKIHRLIIIGFGHAGQTYLSASQDLKKYIDETFIYDLKLDKNFINKKKNYQNKNIFFFQKRFDSNLIDKNTIIILSVPASQKIELLKYIKDNCKLIILEKPPALTKKDFDYIKKNFKKSKLYFALHASKGIEIDQVKKIIGKFKKKDLYGMQINQLFTDPYGKNPAKINSLINSWTDSGLNALSVISEIFGDISKKFKLNNKQSDFKNVSFVKALFNIPSLKVSYSLTTSWSLGIDLKITQVNLPKKGINLTIDHSKQQVYYGFSSQLINKNTIKINTNRLKAHYYEILKEALMRASTYKTHKNINLISNNFYSVLKKIK